MSTVHLGYAAASTIPTAQVSGPAQSPIHKLCTAGYMYILAGGMFHPIPPAKTRAVPCSIPPDRAHSAATLEHQTRKQESPWRETQPSTKA